MNPGTARVESEPLLRVDKMESLIIWPAKLITEVGISLTWACTLTSILEQLKHRWWRLRRHSRATCIFFLSPPKSKT